MWVLRTVWSFTQALERETETEVRMRMWGAALGAEPRLPTYRRQIMIDHSSYYTQLPSNFIVLSR
jgi:hypothetical protein